MRSASFRSVVFVLGVLAALPASGAGLSGAHPVAGPRASASSKAIASARIATENGREEQTERTTRTVHIGANGELDLANISGDIESSRAAPGQDATIEIVKTARAPVGRRRADDAGAGAGGGRRSGAGRAEVRTRYPNGDEMRGSNRRNVNVSVTYTVTAPAGARITARSISGNVSARDMHGELTLESVSGNVDHRQRRAGSPAPSRSPATSRSPAPTSTARSRRRASAAPSRRAGSRRASSRSTPSAATCRSRTWTASRVELQAVSGDVDLIGALSRGRPLHRELALRRGQGDRSAATPDSSSTPRLFSGSIRSDLPLTGGTGDNRRAPAGSARRLRRRQRRARPHHVLGIDRHLQALSRPGLADSGARDPDAGVRRRAVLG